MRAFSELEQKIVHRMIELDDSDESLNVLGNILDSFYGISHLPNYCFIELKSSNDVSIQILEEYLKETSPDSIRKLDKDISKTGERATLHTKADDS